MGHLRHFIEPIESLSPSTAYLSQKQNLLRSASRTLANNLINTLSLALGPTPPGSLHGLRVVIPEHSALGNWLAVYWKAINRPAFLDWADALDLDLATLSLQSTRLQAKAHTPKNAPLQTFTLADDSGWREVAYPILAIIQLIDSSNIGLSYVGNRVEIDNPTLPLELALAFHGYPLPGNRVQIQVIVGELQALNGFPEVDDSGQSKSDIHSELINQQLDYQQLARELEEARNDGQDFDGLQAYHKRITLRSDSLLSHTMKNATRLLTAIIGTLEVEESDAPTATYYYDYEKRTLCRVPPSTHNNTRCITPPQTTQWQALERLADTLQSSVYLDETFSIASLLFVYGLERPASGAELPQLLELLGRGAASATPYISKSARSFVAVYGHRKYLGMLNDRYQMQVALQKVSAGKQALESIALDIIVEMDPDAFGPALEKARQSLLTLTEDPAFIALRDAQGIDPDSHVLLTVRGHVGARGLDGEWKQLSVGVMGNKHLRALLLPVLIAARHSGGQLRSNGEIPLKQALILCNIEVPHNAGEALKTARILAIPLIIKPQYSYYWRALTLSQPSRWPLSQTQNALILDTSRRFLPAPHTHLFSYLSEPILNEKPVEDIRAEADFLLIDLLQSPRARALGEALSNHVDWDGRDAGDTTTPASRKALVLAALILSLDPTGRTPGGSINLLDLTDSYLWGESLAFVRYNFEVSLAGLSSSSAALAAHLLLSNKSPELLIRGVPQSLPYMTSQAWLLFKHYVMYTEQELSGSSRQLTYADLMTLTQLTESPNWARFINRHDTTASIVDWAVANGVLTTDVTYTQVEINHAVKALNEQRERLKNALAILSTPFISLRETALNDLERVYPHNTGLQESVLESAPGTTPYSFVALHMAGELNAQTNRWSAPQGNLDYPQMAMHFHQLSNINVQFGNAFAQRLDQLQVAYVESIRYWLSNLSLPRRKALEYGRVECFSLSKLTSAKTPAAPGRFATLVYVQYYSDQHYYEIFPLHHLIRPRRDLAYTDIIQATTEGNAPRPHAWKRFDWPAYAEGRAPGVNTLQPDVIISKLDITLPAAQALEPSERAPQTLNSARSTALATQIVQRQLLMGNVSLRERAINPLTLEEAADRHDPWTLYVNHLVPTSNLASFLA